MKILKSKFSVGNTAKAINTRAIPVNNYTADLKALNRKISKIMTVNHAHHSHSNIYRLYLPRKICEHGML